jgi:antirestriction protein ArdC
VLAAYQAAGSAAEILHDVHGEAYYQPSPDKIHLPEPTEHNSTAEYYSTLWHEVGHSTGHASRLARPGVDPAQERTPHGYGQEELVAEMTGGMLCAETGVATEASLDNSAAYVRGWADEIKADKKLVVQAAAAAQRAADFVMEPARQAERDTEAEADPSAGAELASVTGLQAEPDAGR